MWEMRRSLIFRSDLGEAERALTLKKRKRWAHLKASLLCPSSLARLKRTNTKIKK